MERPLENDIRIVKIDDTAGVLYRIDLSEAEPRFFDAVAENDKGVYALCLGDTVVGVSLLEKDPRSFLYVYIFPAYRNRGYGDLAVAAAERQLRASRPIRILTVYRSGSAAAKRLAEKHGYVKKYASALMEYRGDAFPEPELPIRHYQDEDYPEAFAMYAEAFHVMRLETGCFPDSAPARPSEKERRYWAEHADDGYVYLSRDEIVGHARIEDNELKVVSVKISHQGRGYGRAFVRYLVNRILEKGKGWPALWCVVGNDKAGRLYDSLGFREICRDDFAVKKTDA